MTPLRLTLATLLTIISLTGFSQSDDNKFCQFIMTNVDTREETVAIDQFIRQQSGIVISRADINSKKYLCIYTPDSGIDRAQIEAWMTQLGVEFKCYREGTHGQDRIIDQKFDCE